jgi:anti-anti-sigma factor
MVILMSIQNKLGRYMSTNSNYKLSGRVDGTNADHYQLEISNLVKTGNQSFTLDLSELVYISSVGLRVFLKTAKDLKVQNRKLILSKPNSEILGLLLMSGFDKIISIEN